MNRAQRWSPQRLGFEGVFPLSNRAGQFSKPRTPMTVFHTDDAPRAMTLNEYQEAAARTLPGLGSNHFFNFAKDGLGEGYSRIDLIHAVFGVAGEAGELCDPVKKAMFYGKPLDVENIREEAGDLLWYIAGPLCRALGCTLEELAAANVAKLRKRYPEKYTDAAAVARADKTDTISGERREPCTICESNDTAVCCFPGKGCPDHAAKPASPETNSFAKLQVRVLTPDEQAQLRQKYKGAQIDFSDGYYWDQESRSWQICPELWESETTNSNAEDSIRL